MQENRFNNQALFDLECLTGKSKNFYEEYKKIGFYDFISFNRTDLFFNLNGFVVDDNVNGVSTGAGLRKKYKHGIFGLNFYHDFQYDAINLHQIGVGIEYFTNAFILYGNLYLPLGSSSFDNKKYIFGDYIGDYIVHCEQRNELGRGFELNLAAIFYKFKTFTSYISMGVYGVSFHKCDQTAGFIGRMRFDISEKLYFEPQFNYDSLYGANFGLKFRIIVPLINIFDLRYRPVSRKMGIIHKKCCAYQTNY